MDEPRDYDDLQPRIATGDADAFARWVAAVEHSLRDGLRSFSASVDVEAVVQETLLRVWQVAPRFAPDGKPNGLFRLGVRIARNLALSELRRIGAPSDYPKTGSDETSPALSVRTPDPLLRRLLRECRERLPAKPATALAERLAAGGEPDEQLAERVGMRVNTFRQNVSRARALLRDCLERQGVDVDTELG